MSLPRLAVNRPVTTAMVLLSLLVLGGISFTRIPLTYLPDVDFPGVFVTVPYPNASPRQIEREIVQPLEEALATIPGARRINSTATADSANLQLEFTWGETVDVARAKVFEAVEDARRDLPSDVKEIYVNTFSTTQIPIVEARISAPGMDLSANYDRLERRIADPIRRVPGVARVDLDGVEPREVRINLRLDRLAAHRVDLGEVTERVSGMNRNVSLGRIRADGVVTPVRGFGALSAIDEIGGLPLNDRGLTVADVAEVTYQEPPIPFGRHLDDETAIGLTVYKSAEANTVEVATAVTELIEAEIAADPALNGINLFVWEDQAEEITSGLSGIRTEGLLGALLAVLVLFLFLRRVDTTSIVSLTIPMSIIATAIVLYFAGRSLNVLSMMGMMLGIGLLVDDAIVVLESVVREHGRGIPAKLAAISGAQAVSGAVIASTVTTAVVFLPAVVGSKNQMSIWLGEIGLAISLTIFCSLFISLTLIPLVSSRLLARKPSVAPRWTERLGDLYQRVLRFTLRRRWVTAGIAVAFLATAILPFFLGLSTAMFSGLNRNRIFLAYEFSDFHYKEDSRIAVLAVERELAGLREELGIESVYSFFAENEAQTVISFGKEHISDAEGKEMKERVKEALPVLPGTRIVFGDDDQETGGDSMFFRVRFYGEDSERLAEFAQRAETRIAGVGGVADIRSTEDTPRKEVVVRPRLEEAARLGITPQDLAEIFGFTLGGRPLRRFQTEDREAEVLLTMSQKDVSRVEDLENFTLMSDGGVPILLGDLADFEIVERSRAIRRVDRKAVATLRAAYEGEEWDDARAAIEEELDAMALPAGYSWSFGDRISRQDTDLQTMAVNYLLALLLIYIVMAAQFESLIHPLAILISIPYALWGASWTLLFTNSPFNLMAQIGMLILMGIVVKNGIVLIDHVNKLRREGMDRSEALLVGGRDRLRPILMTAGATMLALLPMAIGRTGLDGLYYFPLARAVIGGLAASTVLTLVILPFFYTLLDDLAARARRVWRLSGEAAHAFTDDRTSDGPLTPGNDPAGSAAVQGPPVFTPARPPKADEKSRVLPIGGIAPPVRDRRPPVGIARRRRAKSRTALHPDGAETGNWQKSQARPKESRRPTLSQWLHPCLP